MNPALDLDHPDQSRVVPQPASPLGVFLGCPLCDAPLRSEHAHYRCTTCGWRDSCCD